MNTTHKVVSHQDWIEARQTLLAKEEKFTQLGEELSRDENGRGQFWVRRHDEYQAQ